MKRSREEIEEAVRGAMHDLLAVARVDLGASFEALSVDSLDRTELFMEVEERLGLELPDEVYDSACSGRDVVELFEKEQGAGSGERGAGS